MSISRVYTFGEVLKQFRVRTGFSQQHLAEVLHLHRNTISNWECGNDLPKTRPVVLTIAEALHLDEKDTDTLLEASFHERLNAPVWNVPHQRNPFFTGREDVLTRLHEMLNKEKAVVAIAQHALCGLGGIGKTQTVLEYIYRY
jgi:transcriptional regulator with XRE-family HTH domain